MRTINVRAVCDVCSKVEHFTMTIGLTDDRCIVGVGSSSCPDGWLECMDRVYCSQECLMG